ncbi:MAG: spore coat protein [Treponema sp.]|jgi:spore coat polysaccharide biosynthesis protein SpsF|nr:spore coat protein [Treponema sp.]
MGLNAVVLQARLDSSRLPEKSMMLLDGKPLLYRVMRALKNINAGLHILACSEDSFSSFEPLAREAGFEIFSGPKEDVLARYCLAIKHFGIDRVIRATGDNPFVFTDAATAINAEALALDADYAAYSGLPYGAGIESVSAAALLRASGETASSFDREHVCPYLYNHGDIFKLHRPLAPLRLQGSDIRITVDTREDFEKASELYTVLKDTPFSFHGNTIIKKYREIFA